MSIVTVILIFIYTQVPVKLKVLNPVHSVVIGIIFCYINFNISVPRDNLQILKISKFWSNFISIKFYEIIKVV